MNLLSTPMRYLRRGASLCLVAVALPLGANAVVYSQKELPKAYWQADCSSTGRLPAPDAHKPAMVRIFAARTGRWKGIFAVHTWIVVKDRNGSSYQRFEKVGWGTPLRVNAYAPDARWYSNDYETVYAADGAEAEKLIPAIQAAVAAYPYRNYGDYRIWPGPNSNTFTACVVALVPELNAALPATAIGKDYPCGASWIGLTPSHTGIRLSLAGFAGFNIGWIEGLELNILGTTLGVDIRRPALKLPGIGRIGMAAT